MAEFKRKTFLFRTGKEIRLHGNGFGIHKTYEISETVIPNLFYLLDDYQENGKTPSLVSNPHRLTVEELQELADYSIRTWLDFKDNLRRYGTADPRVFNRDDIKLSNDNSTGTASSKKSKTTKEKLLSKGDPTANSRDEKNGKQASSENLFGTNQH